MAEAKKRSNLFQFVLIFAAVYLGSQIVLRFLFPQQFGGAPVQTGLLVTPTATSFTMGNHPLLNVNNKTDRAIMLPSRCPLPPVDVYAVSNPGSGEKLTRLVSSGAVKNCLPTPSVPAGGSTQLSLGPWKYALFDKLGAYEVRLTATGTGALQAGTASGARVSGSGVLLPGAKTTAKARFEMVEPNAFTKVFRTFILAPFLNLLILIASLLPGHNLGLAIILITILIKAVLFWPTQHALEGQKKMQMLQPKLDALKEKYKDNPQRVQEETMKLWKEHKINPLQSCLPTLIQFPILIGLFYTIRGGTTIELSRHLIYPVYQHLSWDFGTMFLGLDLLKPNLYIIPPLLVVLQYLQMKLTFAIQDRKKAKQQNVIDVGEKKKAPPSSQNVQQQMMLYGLPLMIGFFALSLPSAVGLYWGISTLFGIGQQILVNREHIRP